MAIAVVYRDRLEVMGFVVQEDDSVEYDLSPATVSAIAFLEVNTNLFGY